MQINHLNENLQSISICSANKKNSDSDPSWKKKALIVSGVVIALIGIYYWANGGFMFGASNKMKVELEPITQAYCQKYYTPEKLEDFLTEILHNQSLLPKDMCPRNIRVIDQKTIRLPRTNEIQANIDAILDIAKRNIHTETYICIKVEVVKSLLSATLSWFKIPLEPVPIWI